MQEKLWSFDTPGWNKGFPIYENEVMKDTERQYVIKDAEYGGLAFVNKSNMSLGNRRYFFISKEACEQGLVDFLKKDIQWSREEIASREAKINERKKMLKERFNIEVE